MRRDPVIGPAARSSWRGSAEYEDPPRKLLHPSEVLRQRPLSARVDPRGDHGAGASCAVFYVCVGEAHACAWHGCRVETRCVQQCIRRRTHAACIHPVSLCLCVLCPHPADGEYVRGEWVQQQCDHSRRGRTRPATTPPRCRRRACASGLAPPSRGLPRPRRTGTRARTSCTPPTPCRRTLAPSSRSCGWAPRRRWWWSPRQTAVCIVPCQSRRSPTARTVRTACAGWAARSWTVRAPPVSLSLPFLPTRLSAAPCRVFCCLWEHRGVHDVQDKQTRNHQLQLQCVVVSTRAAVRKSPWKSGLEDRVAQKAVGILAS